MPHFGRRKRKRNRSTPTHTNPNKKSKSNQSSSQRENRSEPVTVKGEQSGDQSDQSDQSDVWLDIGSDSESAYDNTSVLGGDIINASFESIHSVSAVSVVGPAHTAISGSTMSDSGSTVNQGDSHPAPETGTIGPLSGVESQSSQPMLNEVNVSGPGYGPQQMFGYSQYGMQPVQPVQFAPQLSEIDVMRIAINVKNLLSDEITQIVSLKVQEQTQRLTSRIDTLEKENGEIKAALSEFQLKADELEQYSRRSCVRISGMEETPNENINIVVGELITRLKLDVRPRDIDRMHRVGRPNRVRDDGTPIGPRDIIVKLCDSNARLQLLKGRKVLRDQKEKIFINEDLTAARMQLAFKCREHMRDKKSSVSKTWTFNGNVFVKDRTGKNFKIMKEGDLDSFMLAVKPTGAPTPQGAPAPQGAPQGASLMAH